METEASLVRADRVIELDTEASLYMNLALVISPGHSEGNDPVRFYKPFEKGCFPVLFLMRINDHTD